MKIIIEILRWKRKLTIRQNFHDYRYDGGWIKLQSKTFIFQPFFNAFKIKMNEFSSKDGFYNRRFYVEKIIRLHTI